MRIPLYRLAGGHRRGPAGTGSRETGSRKVPVQQQRRAGFLFDLVPEGQCRISTAQPKRREVIVSAGTLVATEAMITAVVGLARWQRPVTA